MNHSYGPDPAGGQAALAERVRSLCVAAIFALAGVSEVVELLFNLSAGRVDTHVLMTLACFGTLAIGSGLEVRCLLWLVCSPVSDCRKATMQERCIFTSLVTMTGGCVVVSNKDATACKRTVSC